MTVLSKIGFELGALIVIGILLLIILGFIIFALNSVARNLKEIQGYTRELGNEFSKLRTQMEGMDKRLAKSEDDIGELNKELPVFYRDFTKMVMQVVKPQLDIILAKVEGIEKKSLRTGFQ